MRGLFYLIYWNLFMSYWDDITNYASSSWDSVANTAESYFDVPEYTASTETTGETGSVWDAISGYAGDAWDSYNEPDAITPTIASQPAATSGLSAGIAGYSWATIASIVTVLGFLFMLYRKMK